MIGGDGIDEIDFDELIFKVILSESGSKFIFYV